MASRVKVAGGFCGCFVCVDKVQVQHRQTKIPMSQRGALMVGLICNVSAMRTPPRRLTVARTYLLKKLLIWKPFALSMKGKGLSDITTLPLTPQFPIKH